eukprot:c27773_g1_i2 orf=93-302(-)
MAFEMTKQQGMNLSSPRPLAKFLNHLNISRDQPSTYLVAQPFSTVAGKYHIQHMIVFLSPLYHSVRLLL